MQAITGIALVGGFVGCLIGAQYELIVQAPLICPGALIVAAFVNFFGFVATRR